MESQEDVRPRYRFESVLDKTKEFQKEYPNCQVYCSEQLLQAISDSVSVLSGPSAGDVTKHSVDRPLKDDPATLARMLSQPPTYAISLVESTLGDYQAELEAHQPEDWTSVPAFINAIPDVHLKNWALELNAMWPMLCVRYRPEVFENPKRFSCLPVPNPIVIPGGRFRELYYWDTMWIVEGLLICGMTQTARGIIENFFDLIARFGFIPNANRIYYLNRSQPPLLSEMVALYFKETNDMEFLEKAVTALDQEYIFWMKRRSVVLEDNGAHYVLNRYFAEVNSPRPESFMSDQKVVEGLPEEKKKLVYREIAAACESGWDFSSRWMETDHLHSAMTTQLLPVDLNAILYRFELNLSNFHGKLGHEKEAQRYKTAARARRAAVDKYLWSPERHHWVDYNHVKKMPSLRTYPSNFMGLWAGWNEDPAELAEIVDSFINSHLITKTGVTSSVRFTGQQWDAPNSWAPLQWFIEEGLRKCGYEDLARDIAHKWLLTCFVGFQKPNEKGEPSRDMHEKYHSRIVGARGEGGEYLPQLGFGWTNGIALSFLVRYMADFSTLVENNTLFIHNTQRPMGRISEVDSYNNLTALDTVPVPREEQSIEALVRDELMQLANGVEDKTERMVFQRNMAVFQSLFRQYIRKQSQELEWGRVQAPTDIKLYSTLPSYDKDHLQECLSTLVVLKLNGGLGADMGLSGPKCCLNIGSGGSPMTILDKTVRQIECLNHEFGVNIPLVLMNSFFTHDETKKVCNKYMGRLRILTFQQKQCPRLTVDTLLPLPTKINFTNKDQWYPPGHGDLYDSFVHSLEYEQLKSEGKTLVFVSNIDNLGADVDLNLLPWVLDQGTEFCMEVSKKTPADASVGTLIRYDGHLKLLEMAQLRGQQQESDFKMLQKYSYFNTNNLWIRLKAMETVLPLLSFDVVATEKLLQREYGSRKVLQLETAVGSAIQHFSSATAVCVPRHRFISVKSTSDLLIVQSNVYTHTPDGSLTLSLQRQERMGEDCLPPVVKLGKEFQMLSDFRVRVREQPDLLELEHLTVAGDVHFGRGISLKGTVVIVAEPHNSIYLPDQCLLENKLVSGNLRVLDH